MFRVTGRSARRARLRHAVLAVPRRRPRRRSGDGTVIARRSGSRRLPPRSSRAGGREQDGVEPAERDRTEFFRALAGGEWTPGAWQRNGTPCSRDRANRPAPSGGTAPRASGPLPRRAVNTWQLVGPAFSTNTGGGLVTGRAMRPRPCQRARARRERRTLAIQPLHRSPDERRRAGELVRLVRVEPTNSDLILLGTVNTAAARAAGSTARPTAARRGLP